jgi:FkbM family methyltransferase
MPFISYYNRELSRCATKARRSVNEFGEVCADLPGQHFSRFEIERILISFFLHHSLTSYRCPAAMTSRSHGQTININNEGLNKNVMRLGNFLRSLIPQRVHNDLFRLSSARVQDDLKHRYASGLSMWWSLENLKRCGFQPASVIDVGAFIGEWTQRTREIWPQAKYLMIEPQPNKHERLRGMCNGSVSLEPVLLGAVPSQSVQFFMDDRGGSSVLEQSQDKISLNAPLSMTTLDTVVAGHKLTGPILLKADVQGYELEVLRGASQTLRSVEVILLEVSTFSYNVGSPLFADVVAFMAERRFLVYDLCSMFRRQCDEAMFQVDVLFVREDSALRSEKPFFGK